MSPAQDGRGPLPHTSTWRGLLVTTRTRLLRRNRRDSVNAGRLTPATATSSDVHGSGCGCDSIYGGKLFTSDWLGRDSMPPAAPAVLTRRVGGVTGLRGSRRCGAFAVSNTQTDGEIHTERHTDTCTRTQTRPWSTGGRGYAQAQRTCMRVNTQHHTHHVRCLLCQMLGLVRSGARVVN